MSDGAPAARRPGRPPRLSEQAVLEAADALLSSEGVEAVTIRRVAETLGVSPMALYRHVGDKDDLLLALVDRLAQRLEYPPLPADPRERLMALWRTLYEGLAAHSWLPEVLARRRLMAPSVLWAVEEIHVAFGDAGLTTISTATLQGAIMSASVSPTFATGKICYIEIPATDIDRSAAFYREAFGWRTRTGDDGSVAFDDTVGEVSGTWVLDRPPAADSGLMIYIMVADAEAAADAVLAAGGEVLLGVDPNASEQVATFRDPAGNVLGIYQQPGLAEREATLDPIPEHVRAVTPRIVVRNGAEAIDFYCRAFGAQEVGDRFTGPDGGLIHGEVRIGDSIVAITEEAGDAGPARAPESVGGVVTAIISTYWENVDPAWERALSAGAEVLYPLADHFYGERGGRLRDPFGHQWMLSQRIEDLTHEEIVRRAQKEFSGASGG